MLDPETAYAPRAHAQEFQRFDFDMDGFLEPHECIKFVRACLRKYLMEQHSVSSAVQQHSLRSSTPEDEGFGWIRQIESGSQGTAHLVRHDGSGTLQCLKRVVKEQVDRVLV